MTLCIRDNQVHLVLFALKCIVLTCLTETTVSLYMSALGTGTSYVAMTLTDHSNFDLDIELGVHRMKRLLPVRAGSCM